MSRPLALAMLLASAGSLAALPPEGVLTVKAGKSLVLDSEFVIVRVALPGAEIAEAVMASPHEVVINGRAPGETTLLVWEKEGGRREYDLRVEPSEFSLDAVRRQLTAEMPDQTFAIALENGKVLLRGRARNLTSATRAAAIAGVLGPVVNLLYVDVPAADPQILLKVRFANVDRAAVSELGANIFSTGATNTIGATTTGQFTPPRFEEIIGDKSKLTLTDALNVFLLRPDLNLAATVRALANKRLLEILAEPNLLAMNERPASFLAGGEFPFPTLQGGGAGLGAVTIQFREFGVRITFLPVITPRGTIRLEVTPEVSSLDFSNGLVFQGFSIPALSTRRVQTEIELSSGRSFAIGGLLDQRLAESLSKVPGLGDIPLLGKIFQSRALTKNNTELLVLVTPELVDPSQAEGSVPEPDLSGRFLKEGRSAPVAWPASKTPITPSAQTPIEQLIRHQKVGARGKTAETPSPGFPPIQFQVQEKK
jgi:pilus assembly protein CpaC